MQVKCVMSERVFYEINLIVDDDADDDEIAAAAEEAFVQGEYEVTGQDERQLDSWEVDE
jgi:hypothetical protein